jgi:cytochrome P450
VVDRGQARVGEIDDDADDDGVEQRADAGAHAQRDPQRQQREPDEHDDGADRDVRAFGDALVQHVPRRQPDVAVQDQRHPEAAEHETGDAAHETLGHSVAGHLGTLPTAPDGRREGSPPPLPLVQDDPMGIPTADAPAIDLVSTSSYLGDHPWDQYAWLRANDPVHWHEEPEGPGFWAITKYEDIRRISRQPKTFSSYERGVMMAESDELGLMAQRQMMLTMDPPQHDRFKLLVSRGFTPKNAQLLEARIAELATEIVDDVADRGSCDFVHDIAGRLPSGLIAELMGISRADGERLYALTELMHTTDDAVASREERAAAGVEMLTFAGEVAAAKRANPGTDIASTLVQAELDGDRLTDGELQWFFLLLVNAGGDTTRNLLAAGLQLLFDHPDERARLTADLDRLLPTAVEEMLRYSSPVVNFRRTVMEDTEIRGQPVRAGDKVIVFYGSGNRDEDVFVDADRFDVGRDPNPHMAFGGGGPHLCLGMHVARIEIATMLREVLTRLPNLAPAGPAEPLASSFIAGMKAMPVSF